MNKYPSDWQYLPLKKVYPKIVVGYVGNVNDYYCEPEQGVAFYRTLNIRDGYFRHTENLHVTHEFHEKNKKSQIQNNDILIARVGANLGMVCKVSGLNKSANMANAIIIKTNDVLDADADFYTLFLLSPMGKNQIYSRAAGGAQGVFNTKLTQEILVPIPPHKEQRKIAKILNTWDKAIATTEKLIEVSKQQKKALMQQLLTGKKRFAGFEGEWEEIQLKKIAKVSIGLVTTMTKHYVEVGIPLIRNSDIKQNYINKQKMIYLSESFAKDNEHRKFKKGDIVTVHTGDVGVSAVIRDELEGSLGFATLNSRPNLEKVHPEFLCWFFNSERFINWSVSMSTGDGRQNLNLKDFVKSKVLLPTLHEQKKIIMVLNTSKQETEELEAKLTHLKQEKKALMQQLLTGKRRVNLKPEEAD